MTPPRPADAKGDHHRFLEQVPADSEVGNLVFLELQEHNTPRGGAESVVNSLALCEFDDAAGLVHLDIYLGHEMSPT